MSLKPLIRVAWDEHPALAIELVSRFPGPNIQGAVRWLLLNFPSKVVSEPEALPILLGAEFPHDVRFQLKVYSQLPPNSRLSSLTNVVSPVLGPREPHYSCHLLPAGIQKQSVPDSIRYAGTRKSSG